MRIGGPQIAQGVFTQAWQEDAISLDFYRTYSANQSFSTPKKFFANISEVTKDELYECSKLEKDLWVYVSIRIPNWVEKYVEISGDMDGITQGEQMQLPTCSEGHWWLAPACRSSPETCIPVLIRRRPNVFLEYMQKAAAWRLPWAIAIAKNLNFMSRLGDEPVIWHGQSPTADNLNLKPVFLQFPAFNQELFEQGFRTHEDPAWPYSKLVTRDLERWLPDVREMLQRSWWTVEEAEEFQLKVQQQRRTPEEVACTWLRNQDRWHSWIPRKSSCFYGQGLFDLSTQTFQRNRSNESVCRTCLPGTHSSGIWDVLGSTAECRPCSPGFSQPSVGSRECTQCPPGTFSAGDGAVVCEVCPQGTFQDKFGKSSCVQCATGTTTLIRSASRSEDCECSPGLYLDGDTCRVCPKGLECTGGRTPPKQLAGMYAELHDGSFSVFLCKQHHHCPEGPPGSCVLGRVRRGCSSCKAGTQSSSDGSCVECKPWEVATWLLLLAMIGAGLKAVKWIGTNFRKAALTVAVLGVMFGQVVVCMQSVEAIAQFSLDLTDPAKTLLELLSVFSLDIDRLHLSCFLSSESAVMEYGAQLLIYPVFFVATILLWPLFRRIFRMPSPSVSEYIALHGMLLVALLTSLTLIILQPLQCRGNPNGLATVRARPDVTCWTSEHAVMVAMSIAGVLVFPSATLAAVAFCTWQYPIWLKSPAGLQSFDTWSFLFVRFVPQRFYFGLLLCILNLFTALIPIMMVSAPALQVGMMAVVLWLRQASLCLLWPWRFKMANYNDLALSAGTLLLLNLVSPLLIIDDEDATRLLSILISACFVALPTCTFFAAMCSLALSLQGAQQFDMFLCHHKSGAGAFCRLMKLTLSSHTNCNIFLDSDCLEDVTTIFDTIRFRTRTLVAVLTPETLQRVWCVAEMTTAYRSKVLVLPLYCDNFAFPCEDGLNHIESSWSEEQQDSLSSYGLRMDYVKEALRHIRSFAPCTVNRKDTLTNQQAMILKLAEPLQPKWTNARDLTKIAVRLSGGLFSSKLFTDVSDARILICSCQEPEVISASLVLQMLVQSQLQQLVHFVRFPSEIQQAKLSSHALVILSKGAFLDATFADCVVLLQEQVLVVPINDGTCQFPSSKELTSMGDIQGEKAVAAFRNLLKIIALPLTPTARMDIVHKQVSLICHRLGDIEDRRLLSPGHDLRGVDFEFEEVEELAEEKPNAEQGYVQECF
ncbi:unnamed protein product [Effrenium voratum]|nr:unnamed protein product [Effrenium voratum]